jgi:hypothetical protein
VASAVALEHDVFWKIAIVVVLPLLLYGRSSLFRHPLARLLIPGQIPKRAGQEQTTTRGFSRLYLALLVLAAVAVGSWVVTRTVMYRSTQASASTDSIPSTR